MDIGQIVDWVKQNWGQIPLLIGAFIGFASVFVKFTPTPKDDTFLAAFVKFVSKYIALNKNIPS